MAGKARWRAGRLELDFTRRHTCTVWVGGDPAAALGCLWQREWEAAALIGDRRVLRLYSRPLAAALERLGVAVRRFSFPPGEGSKSRDTKRRLEDGMLRAGLGRRTCVLGLGGGVSIDLAGFVAANYMRGISWIALPTSLLAQVDASLGGKTAVNTDWGKNLLGAFWQPRAVIIDPRWTASLPPRRWREGLVELVKHACIGDGALFTAIERKIVSLARPGSVPPAWLRRGLAVKARLVAQDELERNRRAWLNFGHTVGHALEASSGFRWSHGQAVAAGMVVEAQLAVRRCGLRPDLAPRLGRLWRRLGLRLPPLPPFAKALPYFQRDKKNTGGQIRVALPVAIGRMFRRGAEFTLAVTPRELEESWLLPSV